jgi:hypothetical protein
MIVGYGQVESVSSPQSGFEPAEIPLSKTKIVGSRQKDGEGLVHHGLKSGIGPRRRLGVQAAHAHFPTDQRGKLNPGPMADSEFLGR